MSAFDRAEAAKDVPWWGKAAIVALWIGAAVTAVLLVLGIRRMWLMEPRGPIVTAPDSTCTVLETTKTTVTFRCRPLDGGTSERIVTKEGGWAGFMPGPPAGLPELREPSHSRWEQIREEAARVQAAAPKANCRPDGRGLVKCSWPADAGVVVTYQRDLGQGVPDPRWPRPEDGIDCPMTSLVACPCKEGGDCNTLYCEYTDGGAPAPSREVEKCTSPDEWARPRAVTITAGAGVLGCSAEHHDGCEWPDGGSQ